MKKTLLMVILALTADRLPLHGSELPAPEPPTGWKVQVILYDHPQAASVAVGDATLLQDDTLLVPISVAWKNSFTGYDWYEPEDALRVTLVSHDRGLSWRTMSPTDAPQDGSRAGTHDRLLSDKSFSLPNGVLLKIRWTGYHSYSLSEREKWEHAGYWLYMVPEKKLFSITGPFEVQTSRDRGKTWQTRQIELPRRAFLAGYGMATAKMLSNGTILMPAFGYLTRKHKTYACSVLRSEDGGNTWELVTIAQDESPRAASDREISSGSIWAQFPEALGFDEAQLIETQHPGRVIAIIEESHSKDLYSCISEDYGKTWSKPAKTGMRGNTPLLLRLKSGNLACAYTQRRVEGGMRVCLSRDDGETWDVDRMIVLKDDNARTDGQCLWNFVQFSDGTLFASGWAAKRGCGGGEEHSYAVGFRFTEDYAGPVKVTSLNK